MLLGIPTVVWLGAVCAGLSIPVFWWAASVGRLDANVQNRLKVPSTDLREIVMAQGGRERVVQPGIARFADIARRISPQGRLDSLDRKIVLAGVGSTWPLTRALSAKLILGAGGALIMALRWAGDPSSVRLLLAFIFIPLGMFYLPDLLIGIRAQKRQEEIARTLPDILDQMTIAVEAGLGFDSALAHVAAHVDGPLSSEISRLLQDIKLGMTRDQAFNQMTERTDVQELRQFVLSLQQAERLGIPIATVLRTQSTELRTIRRQRAEEAAQKVPVKMIIPLVVLILPALIIIILAPAIFQALDTF